jgi:hypothetical protein
MTGLCSSCSNCSRLGYDHELGRLFNHGMRGFQALLWIVTWWRYRKRDSNGRTAYTESGVTGRIHDEHSSD